MQRIGIILFKNIVFVASATFVIVINILNINDSFANFVTNTYKFRNKHNIYKCRNTIFVTCIIFYSFRVSFFHFHLYSLILIQIYSPPHSFSLSRSLTLPLSLSLPLTLTHSHSPTPSHPHSHPPSLHHHHHLSRPQCI